MIVKLLAVVSLGYNAEVAFAVRVLTYFKMVTGWLII